jgi:drug/metabolite transporter (DMT)-like permease
MSAHDRPIRPAAAWAAFAGCSLVWGSTFLVISIGNDTVPPLWAAALRLALATVLLAALSHLLRQPLPRGAALGAAALFGLLNMGLSMSLLYWAETRVPSGLVAVLYATIPLTTALGARAAGLERLAPLKVAGALVALGGVGAIFAGSLAGDAPPLPVLAAVAAATCASLSGIALKRGPRQPPLPANAVGSAVGCAVNLAASTLAREPHAFPAGAAALLPILYLAVAGSIVAFGLYAWLVNHWPLTRISFISVVVPVVALALGVAVRGERLSANSVAGSALVMLGLALAIASDRRGARAC